VGITQKDGWVQFHSYAVLCCAVSYSNIAATSCSQLETIMPCCAVHYINLTQQTENRTATKQNPTALQ
jgi:hypothetical protein